MGLPFVKRRIFGLGLLSRVQAAFLGGGGPGAP